VGRLICQGTFCVCVGGGCVKGCSHSLFHRDSTFLNSFGSMSEYYEYQNFRFSIHINNIYIEFENSSFNQYMNKIVGIDIGGICPRYHIHFRNQMDHHHCWLKKYLHL
jgi:hypothetical protein